MLKFQAITLYQEVSPLRPEEEVSRSATFTVNSLSELTSSLIKSKELDLELKLMFTELSALELKPLSLTEASLERFIQRNDKTCSLKILLKLSDIDWSKL